MAAVTDSVSFGITASTSYIRMSHLFPIPRHRLTIRRDDQKTDNVTIKHPTS